MNNITKLPTAAVSYYTVHKRGRDWAVVLVTPCEGMRPIKTALRAYRVRDAAVQDARETAKRMQRPFKEGRA